jgi:hypothetical protein
MLALLTIIYKKTEPWILPNPKCYPVKHTPDMCSGYAKIEKDQKIFLGTIAAALPVSRTTNHLSLTMAPVYLWIRKAAICYSTCCCPQHPIGKGPRFRPYKNLAELDMLVQHMWFYSHKHQLIESQPQDLYKQRLQVFFLGQLSNGIIQPPLPTDYARHELL